MAGAIQITLQGNLTADPELRFTASGQAVVNFTVVQSERRLDRETNEWKDADSVFVRCSLWRTAAENVAESLRKGDRVIVTGRLLQRVWEDREGNKRYSTECAADEVGLSLRFYAARTQRPARSYATEGNPRDEAPKPETATDPHTGEDISPPQTTGRGRRKTA